MPGPPAPARPAGHARLPGLDGVRGLAVVLVVLEHAGVTRPRAGGTGGVTIFFVLSGFLITRLLIAEWDRSGRISLPMFWARRAVRLLPALWVYVAVAGAALALLSWNRHSIVTLSLPALFYYANYATGRVPLDHLAHTWSLAVEEQFYIVWPLLALLAFRFLPRRALVPVLVALTAVGVVVRLWIGNVNPDSAQLKTSLEATFWSLALGATLAAVTSRVGRVPRIPAWVALVVAALGLDLVQREVELAGQTWADRTTVPLGAGLVAVVLILCGLTTSRSWLTFPVLTWMGRRSYAWYLWHWVFVWTNVTGAWSWQGRIPDGLLSAPLGLACAEASWWLVENPTQKAFRRWQRRRGRTAPDAAAAVLPAPPVPVAGSGQYR